MITTHRIEVGGGLQPEGLASDVPAVRDHLEVERAHLVGNSPGGLIGFEIAATVPDRLTTLTTFGTTAQLRSSAALLWTVRATTGCSEPRTQDVWSRCRHPTARSVGPSPP